MSLSNEAETNLLALMFNNTTWANVGDATGIVGSTAAGSYYLSLHTADPGEAGDQTTSEIAYTGYARVAVARTSGGWTVSGNTAVLAAIATFGAMTAGAGGTVTHFGVGTASSGTGHLVGSGTVTPNLSVVTGTTPRLTTGTTITAD